MKKRCKKIIPMLLIIVLFIQAISVCSVSHAVDEEILTFEGSFRRPEGDGTQDWGWGYSFYDRSEKRAKEEYTEKYFLDHIDYLISMNKIPSYATKENVEVLSIDFSSGTYYQFEYEYYVDKIVKKCEEEEFTNENEAKALRDKINNERKYKDYNICDDAYVSRKGDGYIVSVNHEVRESGWKHGYSLETQNKSDTVEDVLPPAHRKFYSEKGLKDVKQKVITHYYPIYKYKIKGGESKQNQGEENEQGTAQIDDGENENNTETLDNGTLLQNAISFVNQVYGIDNASSDNQAVKDLINKRKNATEITAAELTNIYLSNSYSTVDFAKIAYKRALGRDLTENETKDIGDSKLTYSNIVNTVLTNKEFEEICKKYNLEKGVYVPEKFNKGITKENAENFVKHEFQVILGRNPTADELNAIVSKLIDGSSNASIVVSAIFESSEFKNKMLDDEHFVSVLAKATIGKDFEEDESISYTERLSGGTTRNELMQELLKSAKFQLLCDGYELSVGSYTPKAITTTNDLATRFAQNVSKSLLGDNVEPLNGLTSELIAGKKSAGEFIRMYIISDNFKAKSTNMSDEEFIILVFEAAMQRKPTSNELTEYKNEMSSKGNSVMLAELLNSKEFVSICNKYYLPVEQYDFSSDKREQKEVEEKSTGAVITKIQETTPSGQIKEMVVSVKLDISKKVKGDVNGDGIVNSSDASIVLIYTAVLGASSDLIQSQKDYLEYADLNGDNAINSIDATLILIYAAKYGATGNADWNEILNN